MSGTDTAFGDTNGKLGGSVGGLDTVGAVTESNDSVAGRTQNTSDIAVSYSNGTSPQSSSSTINGSSAGSWSVQTGYGSPTTNETLSFTIDFNKAISNGNIYVAANEYNGTYTGNPSVDFTAALSNGNTTTTVVPVGTANAYDFFNIQVGNLTAGSALTISWTLPNGTDYDNISLSGVALSLNAFVPSTPGQTLYYDTNGATAGTSTSSTGNFTDAVWSTDSSGATTTTGYVANSDVNFSAGTNGTGTQQVTVSDAEAVNSFTFNNGTFTLLGTSNAALSIGAGGISNNSTDGATTFDSTLGTITVTADQQWNNNSNQALVIGSGVTGFGQTITFDGTGTGATSLNGAVTGTLNLVQNSSSSILTLASNSNNFVGTISVNAGTVVLDNFLAQNNTINLNGGALGLNEENLNSAWYNTIALGTNGGTVYAGTPSAGVDILYGGIVTGGTTLNIGGGDFLTSGDNASSIGTLNINAGRFLAGGTGFFANNAAVNVASGAILDFGWYDPSEGGTYNANLNNVITLASGAALEARVSTATLNNVVLPNSGTVTLGGDDVGYSTLALNGAAVNLNGGSLALDINTFIGPSNYYSQAGTVDLANQITGSGNLTIQAVGVTGTNQNYGNGPLTSLYLTGNNTYSGTTTLNPLTWTDGGNPAQTDVSYMSIYLNPTGFGTSAVTSHGANLYLTSGGTMVNNFTINRSTSLTFSSGSSDLALTGSFEMAIPGSNLGFGNQTSSNMSVGSITFDKVVGSGYSADFDASGTGGIYLTGTYTSPFLTTDQTTGNFGPPSNGGYGPSSLQFGGGGEENANYYLTSQANFTNMAPVTGNGIGSVDGTAGIVFNSGNLNIENSTWVAGQLMDVTAPYFTNHTVNVLGSQNVNLSVYVGLYNGSTNSFVPWSINQTTADASTWAGNIQVDDAPFTVSAVAGGRLTFSGSIYSDSSSFVKTGAGTVVFSNYNTYGTSSATSFDIQQGTLLITNTTGSAFGSADFDYNRGVPYNGGTVNIELGATLGGTGISKQVINAIGVGSIIAPGDPGQANLGIAPQIGTLHLNGGLTAVNGLTMNFTLDGYANSSIDFGGYNPTINGTPTDIFDLGGVVTINLTGIPTIDATNNGIFKIMTGLDIGDSTQEDNLTFVINAPAGYEVVGDSLGSGSGAALGDDYIYVQLAATPEPSTWAMIFASLVLLAAIGRRQRLASRKV